MNQEDLPQAPRQLSEDEFASTYRPLEAPGGEQVWQHRDTLAHDVHHVWTLMTGDDGEGSYAEAGYHVVNVEGYVVTEVPWVTGAESGVWFDPEYHDFVPMPQDPNGCDVCGRERDLESDPIHNRPDGWEEDEDDED